MLPQDPALEVRDAPVVDAGLEDPGPYRVALPCAGRGSSVSRIGGGHAVGDVGDEPVGELGFG
jgi:hypothetical protein